MYFYYRLVCIKGKWSFYFSLLEQAKAAASARTVRFGFIFPKLFSKKAVTMDSTQDICLQLKMIKKHILM